MVKKLRAQTY